MKYLAIDIGQVICHLDFTDFNRKLAKYANITEREADDFLIQSQKTHDLGYSTLEKDISGQVYGLDIYPEEVADIMKEWHQTVKVNPIVMEWVLKLLDNETEIALVSNIGIEHTETMKVILAPIYDRVVRFFSFEVGARKPTYVYYQTFLNMYPQYKGCCYMDDNISNIESGRLFGFNSIQFDLSKMKNDNEIRNTLTEIEKSIK